MNKEKFNQIIDEVYKHYQETHEQESFIQTNEMGLTRDQFIQQATNNYGFGFLFGITLNERDLTFEEQIQWVMKYTDVELENLAITERVYHKDTPTKLVTLKHKDETVSIYE